MGFAIACRTASFGAVPDAFGRLAEAGVANVESPPPRDGDYAALAGAATAAGLRLVSLSTALGLQTDETAAACLPVIAGTAAIGVRRLFVSAKTDPEVPWDTTVARLRRIAEAAQAHGITICMETHPPLGTNAATALRTLTAVNHPALRFNFDTGNIHYYNDGLDSVKELARIMPWVASVHLKDTLGGLRNGAFPRLGEGIVDFPEVFRVLKEADFGGPCTIEIEGTLVSPLTMEERVVFLRDCLAYLERIGAAG